MTTVTTHKINHGAESSHSTNHQRARRSNISGCGMKPRLLMFFFGVCLAASSTGHLDPFPLFAVVEQAQAWASRAQREYCGHFVRKITIELISLTYPTSSKIFFLLRSHSDRNQERLVSSSHRRHRQSFSSVSEQRPEE